MGLSPKAEVRVTLSMPGEEPKCFCTQERGRGPQQKRKRASSSDLWDKGTLPGQWVRGATAPTPPPHLSGHLGNGISKLTATQKPALLELAP